MSNKEDKRIGKRALGFTPRNASDRQMANRRSRQEAKRSLAR
jgi:hypothetical protein